LTVLLFMASLLVVMPVNAAPILYGQDTDLGKVDVRLWGDGGDDAGQTLDIVGDINGDGIDDLVIGADANGYNGSSAGQVYIYFGRAGPWSHGNLTATANATIIGQPGSWFGDAVSAAGDVNGDGYDDIIVGTQSTQYLVLGRAAGWSMHATVASMANASFGVKNAAGVGDVNGDGLDDLLLGNEAKGTGGEAYLIFGRKAGWSLNMNLQSVSNASIVAEAGGDCLGYSVGPAGDVNADGFDDFLIGAYKNTETATDGGEVYMFLGKSNGWALNISAANASASYLPPKSGAHQLGYAVHGAGDVNADGYDDMIFGAPSAKGTAGEAYLVLGKASGWKNDTNLSTGAAASFQGNGSMGFVLAGQSVAGGGDVNGDGFDDMLIGAPLDGSVSTFSGLAMLELGKNAGWAMNTSYNKTDATFLGEGMLSCNGWAVSDDGDLNGDGFDDVVVGGYNTSYIIFPAKNSKPTTITSVKAYSASSFTGEINSALLGQKIYIELRGTDGNVSSKDTVYVKVVSNVSSPMGFMARLMETGANTGIYRGNITIMDRTHDEKRWIGAADPVGERVTVSSFQDPAKKATLNITVPLTLYPLLDDPNAVEDTPYNFHYWAIGNGAATATWTFWTNVSWLKFNQTTHNISGTPTNAHVGGAEVKVNITNATGYGNEHHFSMVVANTPPVITTNNVLSALEDFEYKVDYNSTDDGQGTVTWQLNTNASFLTMDQAGVLKGTANNDQVGSYSVNLSVDDGNGGKDARNFTLTVLNTNDAPVMTGTSVLTAVEDTPYMSQFQATDVDGGDLLTWNMVTNATGWLKFDHPNTRLYGTPGNSDVGAWKVNVSVKDAMNAVASREFTLTVANVNDVPNMTTGNLTDATEDVPYVMQMAGTDPDVMDTAFEWTMVTKAPWLTMDKATGKLTGTPSNNDVGTVDVTVTVKDATGATDTRAYKLKVLNVNDAPIWKDLPENGTMNMGDVLKFDVNATDVDEGEWLTYSIASEPDAGITINKDTGSIYWTANRGGTITVTLGVSDGDVILTHQFTIYVNTGPKATLMSPEKGATVELLNPTLTWTVQDVDGDEVTVDVYLSPYEGPIKNLDPTTRVAQELTGTSFSMDEPLKMDATYFWTVIPSDQAMSGSCESGIWSFKTSSEAKLNNLPVFISTPSLKAGVGDKWSYVPLATDNDLGDTVTITLESGPDGMRYESGKCSWTPKANQLGTWDVVLMATDGKGNVDQTFIMTVTEDAPVNNPPVFDEITGTVTEGIKTSENTCKPKYCEFSFMTIQEGQTITITLKASDADDDKLTFGLNTAPDEAYMDPTNGTIKWTPKSGEAGKHRFVVEVMDGFDTTSTSFDVVVEAGPTTGGGVSKETTSIIPLPMLWPLVLIMILAAVVVVGIMLNRRRGKAVTAPPQVTYIPPVAPLPPPPPVPPQAQGQYRPLPPPPPGWTPAQQ